MRKKNKRGCITSLLAVDLPAFLRVQQHLKRGSWTSKGAQNDPRGEFLFIFLVVRLAGIGISQQAGWAFNFSRAVALCGEITHEGLDPPENCEKVARDPG